MHLILWKKKWTLPNTFRFIGRKEGKYEGRKEGRDEGRKEIIFDMFRNNITVDQMSNFVNLEKTKLLELKKEYDKINNQA